MSNEDKPQPLDLVFYPFIEVIGNGRYLRLALISPSDNYPWEAQTFLVCMN